MTGGLDDPTGNGPRLLFADHHDALDAACRDLDAAAYCDDPLDLIKCYRTFEAGVVAHLRAEEEELLEPYATFDRVDADRIRDEHAALRAQLYKLGIEVELHAVRAGSLEQMIETLRAHALHEDRGLYPWAQVHLPLSARRRLFIRLSDSLETLARWRRAFRDDVTATSSATDAAHE